MCPQIASFSVTPNYEIIFFSSDIYEVANILDFFDGTVSLSTVKSDLENFKIGGKSSTKRYLYCTMLIHVLILMLSYTLCLCFDSKTETLEQI